MLLLCPKHIHYYAARTICLIHTFSYIAWKGQPGSCQPNIWFVQHMRRAEQSYRLLYGRVQLGSCQYSQSDGRNDKDQAPMPPYRTYIHAALHRYTAQPGTHASSTYPLCNESLLPDLASWAWAVPCCRYTRIQCHCHAH